jgi:hypothetical protein
VYPKQQQESAEGVAHWSSVSSKNMLGLVAAAAAAPFAIRAINTTGIIARQASVDRPSSVPAGTPQKGRFAGLLGSWLGWDLLGCWAPRRRPGLHSSGSPCKQQLARGKGSDAKCFCRFAGLRQQRAAGYGCAGLSGIAAESFGYKLHIELHTGVKGIGRSGTSDRDGRPQTLS